MSEFSSLEHQRVTLTDIYGMAQRDRELRSALFFVQRQLCPPSIFPLRVRVENTSSEQIRLSMRDVVRFEDWD